MKKNKLKILLVLSVLLCSSMVSAQISVQQPALKAVYNEAASDWESEATPIGNGYMGAMIFGGVESDLIQINEKTLWSGGPGKNANYNGGHSNNANTITNLKNLRNALQEKMTAFSANDFSYINDVGTVVAKDYAPESTQLRSYINALMGNKNDFGSYQTVGNLNITYIDAIQPAVIAYDSDARSSNPAEDIGNLFDGNSQSKWFADRGFSGLPCYVQWEYDRPKTAVSYSLRSGGDMQPRDPQSWELWGSTDGDDYEIIDIQSHFDFSGRGQLQTFQLESPVTYKYYKMVIRTLHGDVATYQPQLSEIILNSGETSSIQYSNYERTLDIDNAIATVSYTEDGVDFAREYFMSYPQNVMAIRLTASEAGKLSRVFWISTPQTATIISAEGNVITMTGKPADHRDDGLKFAQQFKIINTGGTLTADAGRITVTDADEILVLMSAATNYVQCMDETFNYFSSENPLNAVQARINSASLMDYETLKDTHIADYKSLYDRMSVSLNNVTVPTKNTKALLAGYKNNTNTPEENRYLEMLYYQFGRYLLIGSSRPNSLPANLQGVWADGLNPPWAADYHTNINLQMNYWLAQQTNLAECHIPMIEYVQSLVPRGRQTAQRYYCKQDGTPLRDRGWVIHHENNVWGNTAPGNWYEGFYFPAGAAWVCQDIWEYYQFTNDEQMLRDNYEILLDAAIFWVDNLWTDARDGSLVANPSYSPEHGPYSLGASADQAIIWELFDFVIKASEILGENSPEIEEVKAAKSRLAGPQIGLAGQFMEWKDELRMDITGDNGHRHVNHLHWLHPGSQVIAGRSVQDSLYVNAMKTTLNTRGDGGTGWSKAWKINFWARLHDGNRSHKLLSELLKESTLTNLFDTHPPFQIDGNFGGTAGVTEMLVQSQGGYIELLPALPEAWNTGAFQGIKARGNFEISAEWDSGELDVVEITSNSGNTCIVKYPNIASYSTTFSTNVIDNNTISFDTEVGETYVFVK